MLASEPYMFAYSLSDFEAVTNLLKELTDQRMAWSKLQDYNLLEWIRLKGEQLKNSQIEGVDQKDSWIIAYIFSCLLSLNILDAA